jgi:superfamily II DNA/RNA helicase
VINYQCTEDEKTYLHRIGRTARAGNTGTAVTFVDWDDLPRWSLIDKALDLGIPEPQETYSSSHHLFEDLDIPEGTRGTLPRAARTRAGLDAEVVEDLGETGRGPRGSRDARPGRADRDADSAGSASRGRRRTGVAAVPAGARDVSAEGAEQAQDAERSPRSTRSRRRTRGGMPVDGGGVPAVAVASGAPEGATGRAPDGSTDDSMDGATGGGAGSAPRRRRRRRGGRGTGGEGAGDAAVTAEA